MAMAISGIFIKHDRNSAVFQRVVQHLAKDGIVLFRNPVKDSYIVRLPDGRKAELDNFIFTQYVTAEQLIQLIEVFLYKNFGNKLG